MQKAGLLGFAFLWTVTAAAVSAAESAPPIFPGANWKKSEPGELGWSPAGLEKARRYFETLPPASVVVIDDGVMMAEWGDSARRIKISSMRKSILSALVGIAAQERRLDLNLTLEQLGIDDTPPLVPAEKQATVRMLLASRSGVYHSYVAGTPGMRTGMPSRGSHPPGTYWFYNNWDFNALGTIFERQLNTTIGAEFSRRLAGPLQMQDFRGEDMYYLNSAPDAEEYARSVHPAYHFRLTARDLARFGYLFLQRGNWNGQRIISSEWVAESTRAHSDDRRGGGYGYLWWVDGLELPVKSYRASGALGKHLVVIPERHLVVVYLNHEEFPDDAKGLSDEDVKKLPSPTTKQFSQLLNLLLEAQQCSGGSK